MLLHPEPPVTEPSLWPGSGGSELSLLEGEIITSTQLMMPNLPRSRASSLPLPQERMLSPRRPELAAARWGWAAGLTSPVSNPRVFSHPRRGEPPAPTVLVPSPDGRQFGSTRSRLYPIPSASLAPSPSARKRSSFHNVLSRSSPRCEGSVLWYLFIYLSRNTPMPEDGLGFCLRTAGTATKRIWKQN